MDFFALAMACAPQVDPSTLAAIVRTESSFNPLAININGKKKLDKPPKTKEEAIETSRWLISQGYNIDMGLAQINSANLRKLGVTVEDMFDPCKNLAASATILTANYKGALKSGKEPQVALKDALSMYNTGSYSRGYANGYVQKVVTNAKGVRIHAKPVKMASVQSTHDFRARENESRPVEQKPAVGAQVVSPVVLAAPTPKKIETTVVRLQRVKKEQPSSPMSHDIQNAVMVFNQNTPGILVGASSDTDSVMVFR